MNIDELYWSFTIAYAVIFGYIVVKLDEIKKELKEIKRRTDKIWEEVNRNG